MSHQDSTSSTPAASLTLTEALFGFYRRSMYVFLKPTRARFAEEASGAKWSVVWMQILIMTLIMGLLTFLWGRLPLFIPATSLTRPLPISTALILAVTVPAMFFIIGGMTIFIAQRLDGKGTFLAQAYTSLLIGMPLFIFSMVVLTVSLHLPTLGLILGCFDFLLLIYGVVLQVFAMMTVHSIGVVKATLIVLGQAISIIAVALVIAFVFIAAAIISDNSDSSGTTTTKSGGDTKQKDTSSGDLAQDNVPLYPPFHPYHTEYITEVSVAGARAPQITLSEASCPTCHYKEWVGQLRVTNELPCVNCGTQMISTGKDHHGKPPKGYFEVQCPQCQYHEWTTHHRLDAGVMCINCGLRMQPTGNSW